MAKRGFRVAPLGGALDESGGRRSADPGFGLKILPAAILRNVLQQYPSGGQFFSEALQNADDTGRAANFRALLDLRHFPLESVRPPASRRDLQRESIVFYDDAGFTDRDWRSLQFMCDSEKRTTPHETGAFGMGSRSYFHITDVLQVLSGSRLSWLDPDDMLQSGHFGEQIDFVKDPWRQTCPDEAKPFEGLFGCSLAEPFKGTIIRAALRSIERGKTCTFMPKSFELSRAIKIFNDFEETLKNGEVILFLTCVTCVELWRWDRDAAQPTLTARAKLGISSGHALPLPLATPREAREFLKGFNTFEALGKSLRDSATEVPIVHDIIETSAEFFDNTSVDSRQRWLRYGLFFRDEDTIQLGITSECVPMLTLALPLDSASSVSGRLFTVLPLPLYSQLPVHINAPFRLHVNRRAMWRMAPDLEGEHKSWALWNEHLLGFAAPQVYAKALQWLANAPGVTLDQGHSAWPSQVNLEKEFALLLDPLVQNLAERPVLATPSGEVVRPDEALFVPTLTKGLQACRERLLQLCLQSGWKVVDPPSHIVELLTTRDALSMKSCEWLLLDIVLPAAAALDGPTRIRLLLAFLEWVGSWPQDEIVDLGSKCAGLRWLPTEGGEVRATHDVFDPDGSPEVLGVVRVNRARIAEQLSEQGLNSEVVWQVLRIHGAKTEITWEDALEEAEAAAKAQDATAASRLLEHLDRHHSAPLRGHRKEVLARLATLPWAPATRLGVDSAAGVATQLLSLKDLFPCSSHKYVWAVAPCLCFEAELSLEELRPHRSVHLEPGVLSRQVQALALTLRPPRQGDSALVCEPDLALRHLRTAFTALPTATLTLREVVLTALAELDEPSRRTSLLLAFLEWAASALKESDIKELGTFLRGHKWLPTASAGLCEVRECFRPVDSRCEDDDSGGDEQSGSQGFGGLQGFQVVQTRTVSIGHIIEDLGLDASCTWRALVLLDIKEQLTWEDAVEEAESAMRAVDTDRAARLLKHLDAHHASLKGGRAISLQRLRGLAWVPAAGPTADPDSVEDNVQLARLQDIFPPTARNLVWAVASSLRLDSEPNLPELRPGRTLEKEPCILAKQVCELLAVDELDNLPARRKLEYMRLTFEALAPTRVVPEVVLPSAANLNGAALGVLVVAFLDWAARDWEEVSLKELGRQLGAVKWLPIVGGECLQSVGECFDPDHSPSVFGIVQRRTANLGPLLEAAPGVDAERVWRVLRLGGVKQELTWEDIVEEAESISALSVADGAPASLRLYGHIDSKHSCLKGCRDAALSRLQSLAWVPATVAVVDSEAAFDVEVTTSRLMSLKDLFPRAALRFVWKVAPCLLMTEEANLRDIRAGRDIEEEPSILVEQLCALVARVPTTKALGLQLEHLRTVFGALSGPPRRTLDEVVFPAVERLAGTGRCTLLLALAERAAGWNETEVGDLCRRLWEVKWLPRQDGVESAVRDCFDPEESPCEFCLVSRHRANVVELMAELGVDKEAVLKTLRLCGLKLEITWEDVVEEAETIVSDSDFARASLLFAHLNDRGARLSGSRAAAMERLLRLPWAPAVIAGEEHDRVKSATRLLPLKEVFPLSARALVWAVAPCLSVEAEPTLTEFRAELRSVDKEFEILAKQAQAVARLIAATTAGRGKGSGSIGAAHLRAIFAAVSPARAVSEVVKPVASSGDLETDELCALMLVFLEWVGVLSEDKVAVRELCLPLAALRWVPNEAGDELHAVEDCFGPPADEGAEHFETVRAGRARLGPLIDRFQLDATPLWKVLYLCGLKQQMTWEDAAEEASSIAAAKDVARARHLQAFLFKSQEGLRGNRSVALERLCEVQWMPALAPTKDPNSTAPILNLLAPRSVFPAAQRGLVWAVAATMVVEEEPPLPELRAGRSVGAEPSVLGQQLRLLLGALPQRSAAADEEERLLLPPSAVFEHIRAIFDAMEPIRILEDVILPTCSSGGELGADELATVLLVFLTWAKTATREGEVRALGRRLADIPWVPTAGVGYLPVAACFDPERSPRGFSVVSKRPALVESIVELANLEVDVVWAALRLCGLKAQLTWEDVIEEAEAIAKEGDVARAGQLYVYLDAHHPELKGDRAVALDRLTNEIAWAPGAEATTDYEVGGLMRLFPLSELFSASEHALVWSVGPVLCMEVESTLEELRPGRSVQSEPEILIDQLRAIADAAATTASEKDSPCISSAALEHFVAVFGALGPLLPKLEASLPQGSLADHPKLKGVRFIPCLPPEGADAQVCATLFATARSTFQAQHDHRALSPAIGIVKPMDYTIRRFAEAVDVTKFPRPEALVEALQEIGQEALDLAITLANELASRLRQGEERPKGIRVPTSTGDLRPVEEVYIDDATWKQGHILTLHPRISAEAGGFLGCTSVRAQMIKQCEDAGATQEGDPFGQEADLVSQVKQLLQEYGDSADLIKEFVQNTDDAGADCLTLIIDEETFGCETIIDPRTAALQGPALYICSDKPLTDDDIANMQRVGHSKKRLDFFSSGRFGVGLNVMYRFCDCPQLLANGCLHFFDLTRGFVAQPGRRRGRKFNTEKFKGHFPDSYAPFLGDVVHKFPTVFRLALRTATSELGVATSATEVREELTRAASIADKMLLFTRTLSRLEFYNGLDLLAAHQAEVKDSEGHANFFAGLPTSPTQMRPGKMNSHLAQICISSEGPEGIQIAEWAITHRVGVSDDKMLKVLKQQFERPGGVALFPHGACAVKIAPWEEPRIGRICCGLPTIFGSGCSAWIHGGFALLSSRKSLPLPEQGEDAREVTLDKTWNKMLLEGPVAESLHALLLHCTALVLYHGLKLEQFFALFPLRGEALHSILATALMKAAMKSAIFPVIDGAKISWVEGPTPTFFCSELTDGLQMALVSDGMKLVTLSEALIAEYETALGQPRKRLDGLELAAHLRQRFTQLHGDAVVEVDLGDVGMSSVLCREFVLDLLGFVAKSLWKRHYETNMKKGPWALHTFKLNELQGVPLLLTASNKLTTFSDGVNKFCTRRDVLPARLDLYVDKECHRAILDAVDCTAEGISRVVQVELPWIHPFSLEDLVAFKEDLEESIRRDLPYMHPENSTIRNFWAIVAEYGTQMEGNTKKARTEKSGKPGPTWQSLVGSWKMFPVISPDGPGENGEEYISVLEAKDCVAVTMIEQNEKTVQSLTGLLQLCGLTTVQAEVLMDERVANIVCPYLTHTADAMLMLLATKGNFEHLTAPQRHDLLAYYSVLGLMGGVDLKNVRRLPLFKTAVGEDSYTTLQAGQHACCIDENDKHAKALCKLVPPGLALLAWPTQQVKPIYEQFGVQLNSAEDFMVNFVIPALPYLCSKDPDGASAQPFLQELYTFVCVDKSDRVRVVAMHCSFVPSLDGKMVGPPRQYVASESACVTAFSEVLGAAGYLPVRWLQERKQHVELLVALGMRTCLSPAMILHCARKLDEAFALEAQCQMEAEANLAAKQAATAEAQRAKKARVEEGAKKEEKSEDEADCKEAGEEGTQGTQEAKEELKTQDAKDEIKTEELTELPFVAAVAVVPVESSTPDSEPARTARKRARGRRPSPKVQQMSFELVEVFAAAAEDFWPDPCKPQAVDIQDMTRLLEAAGLRILLARRYSGEAARKKEVSSRNGRRQTTPRLAWQMDDESGQLADVELVPFEGTAFEMATSILWTVSPLAAHSSYATAVGKEATHLEALVAKHRSEMHTVFNCFTMPENGPPQLVMQHLTCLCPLLEAEADLAYIKPLSVLHEDFKASWYLLSEYTDYLQEEMANAISALQEVPCVACTSEDVADRPSGEILLTMPRYAFFNLPLFQGKEANLRLYLRQASASTAKEAALFRALGAREKPTAADYARASSRIAARAGKFGQMEWLNTVIETCIKGVYDEVAYLLEQGQRALVRDLHMFAADGTLRPARELVWLDTPRWASRCAQEKTLQFCQITSSHDQRDVAKCLTRCAGLRELSQIVSECRLTGDLVAAASKAAAAEEASGEGEAKEEGANKTEDAAACLEMGKALLTAVERLVRSYELAAGLRAVLLHIQEAAHIAPVELSKLREDLCSLRFKVSEQRLQSALVWRRPGGGVVAGSVREQKVFYDSKELCIFLQGGCNVEDEIFVAELVSAMRLALPLLWKVESFMLEAMIRSALRDGPSAVQVFLESRDIKLGGMLATRSRHLGPGDKLPEDLLDHVLWSMNAIFCEGECAAILLKDVFTIVEVARWPVGESAGDGISRCYRLKVSAETFEARKHFEVYKIHGTGERHTKQETEGVVPTDGGPSYDFEGVVADGDAKHIEDVKRYLREMAKMPPEEYKSVMRRLFKTWHPDKAGDTPLSRTIFRLLRRHEQWYKKRLAGENPGDDSWLDEVDASKQDTGSGETLELPSTEPMPVDLLPPEVQFGQGSWFDEFENELQKAKVSPDLADLAFCKSMAVPPDSHPVPGPAPGSPGRIVDKNQAPRWLHQAKMELLAACSLVKPAPGLRALPAAAVWHSEQAVEMCIKAAMYRTCGVSEDESIGSKAHDITTFVTRLRLARAMTEEQARGQDVPIDDSDVQWLKSSYLNARYPKANREGIPAELYSKTDAERAIRIADKFLKWAATIEDLPDPGVGPKEVNESEHMLAVRKRRWSELLSSADNKELGVHSAEGVPPRTSVPPANASKAGPFVPPMSKFSPPVVEVGVAVAAIAPPKAKATSPPVPQQDTSQKRGPDRSIAEDPEQKRPRGSGEQLDAEAAGEDGLKGRLAALKHRLLHSKLSKLPAKGGTKADPP